MHVKLVVMYCFFSIQRHQVRVIPVSEIHCSWTGKVFTYWVYGTDNTAYAPEYPQQCCCGCSIL